MKNGNSPKKEIFCHYLKNFVTKLQLKNENHVAWKKKTDIYHKILTF